MLCYGKERKQIITGKVEAKWDEEEGHLGIQVLNARKENLSSQRQYINSKHTVKC